MKKTVLDAEEKDILESYERGEWRPIKNPKAEIKKLREYARNTLQKDKRINIKRFGPSSGYCCPRGHPLPNTYIQHHP